MGVATEGEGIRINARESQGDEKCFLIGLEKTVTAPLKFPQDRKETRQQQKDEVRATPDPKLSPG